MAPMRRWWAMAVAVAVAGACGGNFGARADEDVTVETQADPAEEPASTLVELNAANIDEEVFRSRRTWVVLVTASEGCPMCEMMENVLESAERMSKGLARFGVLDAARKENQKVLQATGQGLQVPQVRVYLEHGQRNLYKKSEFFRDFVLYTGAQSARGLKKFLFEEVAKNAPVASLGAATWKSWLGERGGAGAAVVAFSSKSSPSSLLAGLGRALAGAAPVAQYSGFGSEEDDAQAAAAAAAAMGGVEGVPALAVRDVGENAKWSVMSGEALSKATLDDLLDFVKANAPGLGDLSRLGETSGGSTGAKQQDGAGSSSLEDRELGVVRSAVELKEFVLDHKLPVLLAIRRPGGAERSPADWSKFQSKAFGVGAHIVYCDEGAEQALKDAVCAALSAGEGEWELRLRDYVAPAREGAEQAAEEPAIRDWSRVDSLAQARSDALATIPDTVVPVPASMTQGFVSMAVQSQMQAIILFGKQKDPPAMLTAVAAALQGLALFGYRGDPKPKDLEAEFGIPPSMPLPVLAAMIVEKGDKPEETRMMLSVYDRARFGKFSYHSILSFALQVASQSIPEAATPWLKTHGPGIGLVMNTDEDVNQDADTSGQAGSAGVNPALSFDDPQNDLEQLDTAQKWSRLCPDSANAAQLMCVIGFFDGDPLNSELAAQKAVLQAAREKLLATPAGKARLRFLWADGTCQSDFMSAFEVEATALPGVVVYHPRKRVAFKMLAGFSEAKLEKFLNGVVAGRGKAPRELAVRPELAEVDCSALASRAVPVEDGSADDEGDEDWLAEIRAEEAREAAERKAALQRELDEIKAQKEAAAKAEADSASSKRRRRRRRRKASSEKDEL